ncbi:MAG: hypothetical protein J0H61_00205 [Alphaproteobacteria bacterium]|nr:hypothetical protein [Alphaproteobacteria bacterium]
MVVVEVDVVVAVTTLSLPPPDATSAIPPATTPRPRTISMVLSAACAFCTPAGLPGASGAAAFVPAKALETSRLVARMAAPIVRMENSSNGLSTLHFFTQPQTAMSMNR